MMTVRIFQGYDDRYVFLVSRNYSRECCVDLDTGNILFQESLNFKVTGNDGHSNLSLSTPLGRFAPSMLDLFHSLGY
jgi:hypothetical protein